MPHTRSSSDRELSVASAFADLHLAKHASSRRQPTPLQWQEDPSSSSSSSRSPFEPYHSRTSSSSFNAPPQSPKMVQPSPPQQYLQQHPAQQNVWPPIVIQLEEAPQPVPEPPRTNVDTYDTRMDRINTWRDAALPALSSNDLKRRDLARAALASKQSQIPPVHRCPACDATFATRQNLKRHSQGVRTSPACRIAVEYSLE
ncbi:hypothetical protein SISSUDRAFT_1116589 [Sistotremastrum suecicum HHB10207 ss-3]|uniref:C2H2-type domain-containing protein n=1 Tax=Sistotremastrum suecicum HHB10207 ss-3 TaxID=1314776 RepID=A0A166HZ46_9AGAM|nr:hypothetical protein SISSUDRAFT_1116589 [Sistotremastrum suecicum HHB10207 ss-3]